MQKAHGLAHQLGDAAPLARREFGFADAPQLVEYLFVVPLDIGQRQAAQPCRAPVRRRRKRASRAGSRLGVCASVIWLVTMTAPYSGLYSTTAPPDGRRAAARRPRGLGSVNSRVYGCAICRRARPPEAVRLWSTDGGNRPINGRDSPANGDDHERRLCNDPAPAPASTPPVATRTDSHCCGRPPGGRGENSIATRLRAATACLQPALRDRRAVAGSFWHPASACSPLPWRRPRCSHWRRCWAPRESSIARRSARTQGRAWSPRLRSRRRRSLRCSTEQTPSLRRRRPDEPPAYTSTRSIPPLFAALT